MKILCAGPTYIDESVMEKMGQSKTNPDLDPNYEKFHRSVERKISKLVNTDARSFIMLGEAILGLEASICSLMEKGEKVLVIYNGFFGEGFASYVEGYGGTAYRYEDDFQRGINLEKLENFLKNHNDFSIATMVHCETPTGITNDIKSICSLLKKYDILTVVDAVSSVGGEFINFDDFNIDVLIAGSQKCISAPVGLTLITISEAAKAKIKNRKSKIPSYYLNFENSYDFKGAPFPYTFNENLVYALDRALDLVLQRDFVKIHRDYALETREIFTKCGFELFAKDSLSNTLTAVKTPENIKSSDILKGLIKRDIIISKGVAQNAESIFRIGHMGNNISLQNFKELYIALDEVFKELNVKTKASLYETFLKSDIVKKD
ncbi:pyridoxal-phosphate-dependent aminotransferase family protein [Anaerosphaera multitolerans]|uniref:Alanine--glyoxylate aminotransferase family protein n=1 Tax=Anaerosphaera multitolerans TaxID=2487351 RepID=A0A437S9Q4_9FIRM|nr:alanine--glyoxylate aminotransferase family protein [Anaerosphaera multitolerans]RVU55883.1 alanine--glyoxylate aminotransferase family protein [Anaerosphaera multitolerans]